MIFVKSWEDSVSDFDQGIGLTGLLVFLDVGVEFWAILLV